MNYFTHGRRFVSDPFFLAGTAVPDWLSVVHRRARARAKLARPFAELDEPHVSAVARGILQHHHDDGWFHQTRAFAELSWHFTKEMRDRLPADDGFRPSFLGHILVELLLDATLIEDDLPLLDEYYRVMDELDPWVIAAAVNRMTTEPTGMLAFFIPRFSAERFLYDYLQDAKLLYRLNNVMRRVRLPALPDAVAEFFPEARRVVRDRAGELLAGEESPVC